LEGVTIVTDRTTKALLSLIALGLWANALAPMVRSLPANASGSDYLQNIDFNISRLEAGTCVNGKLC
jgi:hypothetical protein